MKYSIKSFVKSRPKTKIVCTIGPASGDRDTLKKLIKSGMSVARLNLSHGSKKQHLEYVNNAKEVASDLDTPLAILIDVPGPKFRIGKIPNENIQLKKDSELLLTNETNLEDAKLPELKVWPAGIHKDAKNGTTIFLDDGAIKLKVIKVSKDKKIKCKILNQGILKSNKAVAIPGTESSLGYFTEETIKGLNFAKKINATFVGLSFIRNEKDVQEVKKFYKKNKFQPQLISKIELPSSIPHLKEIIMESDGVMVARGDLGVQLPIEKVPGAQKLIINEANKQGKPVITATQMLESMIETPTPTRAEATDIYNAVMDGTDAIMLSAETSVGKYPVEAVKNMSRISLEAEAFFKHDQFLEEMSSDMNFSSIDYSIAYNACKTSNLINSKAILAFTESGSTAGRVSSFRPKAPILGLIHEQNKEKLLLRWGVIPVPAPKFSKVQAMFYMGSEICINTGIAKNKDYVVAVVGMPIGVPGNTNLLRVINIPEPKI